VTDYHDVICCLQAADKNNAIREVVEKCPVFNDLPDKNEFIQAVMQREQIESTGIGRGVAIAHGKVRDVGRIRVGLGLSQRGIDFSASDGKPVHLLFVIGSSPLRQVEYLKTLAAIMRFVKSTDVRDELIRHAADVDFNDEKEQRCLDFLHMMAEQHFAMFFDTQFRNR